jgi:riboflavin kinase / FMN adenylyltransferase
MTVWRSADEVPRDLGRTVVTIGNFDGVHRGHRHVVARARELAGDVGAGRVVAVTFDPHPIAVLRPEHAPNIVTGIEERARLLAEAGVDDVLVVPFTREVAAWSPERFIEEILVETLRAAAVVVGASFRFGSRASGDVGTLVRIGDELERQGEGRGFVAEGVPLDGGPQVWSSTYVRTCLAAGDVEGAAEALGRPVSVRGVVVEGDRRGRDLGYPTANVPPGQAAVPADGVYAGWLHVPDRDDSPMPAAVSVGTNPTFDGERARRVEAYVLDRDDLQLYGVEVTVELVTRLRGMTRFDGVEDLLSAMAEDVAATRRVLGLDPEVSS